MRGTPAERFEAVSGFSSERNPNGPWSYGAAKQPGEFILFGYRKPGDLMPSWQPTPALSYPYVGRNATGKLLHGGGELLPTNCLILAPGNLRRDPETWSVVRFTAPSPGLYRFSGSFESLAMGYGGTSQLILHGARRLAEHAFGKFQGEIWEFDLEQDLRPGERVDFMVSASPNGDNASDSTGLALVVERWEHLSLLWPAGLGGLALAGLAALRLRRGPARDRTGR